MAIQHHTFEDSTVKDVEQFVDHFDDNPLHETNAYKEIGRLVSQLSPEIIEVLIKFRESNDVCALVMKGLPLGRTSTRDTPTNPVGPDRFLWGFQALSLATASLLGTPYAYETQQGGRLINNIVAAQVAANQANMGTGSRKSFGLHTEDAFMEAPPSYLQLSCIRNPERCGTVLAELDIHKLESSILDLLRESTFVVGTNPTQKDWTNLKVGPVIYGPVDRPFLRFNLSNTSVADHGSQAHEAALEALGAHLQGAQQSVVNEPGDIMLVNNYTACHGRPPFEPAYNGNDRWLQRIVAYRNPNAVAPITELWDFPTLVMPR